MSGSCGPSPATTAPRFIALGEHFIPRLADSVLPEARELLARHRKAGHDRIVVSASPIEIVSMLAERLGLEGAVGTRAEIDEQGRHTGRLAGAFCYREGKVAEIDLLARTQGYDLSASYGYSDSISDLPFLRMVGHPVAVNPDAELRAHALAHRWPVVEVQRPSIAARLLRRLPLPATRRPAR